jgi:hypothetical protein
MTKYHCRICKRSFSTPSGLTQHVNAVHHGRRTLSQPRENILQQSQQYQPITRPEHDADLWSMAIARPSRLPSNEEVAIEKTLKDDDVEDQVTEVTIEETLEETGLQVTDIEESLKESLLASTEDIGLDSEDLKGATLDDALETIEGKNKPERLAE